jgi:hypothetical protein
MIRKQQQQRRKIATKEKKKLVNFPLQYTWLGVD